MAALSYNGIIGNIEKLEKGTSDVQKYKVNASNGSKYLISVHDFTHIERIKKVAALLKTLDAEGVPAQKFVDLVASESLGKIYLVVEWCDGADGFSTIPGLTKTEQYNLGLESGKILQKIHSLLLPTDDDAGWSRKITNQTRDRIQQYQKSGYQFDCDEDIIKYLEENITLVKDRPQSLRHGDYHFGNMIVSPETSLTIIDWHSYGYGDPWEEFQQTAWYAVASPLFAVGQLHGYFNGEPPVEFFPVLAFYMASCAISSIVYAASRAEHILDYMIVRGKDTAIWFERFKRLYPSWYIMHEHINNILLSTDTKEDNAMSLKDDAKALQEERERRKREQAEEAARARKVAEEAGARKRAVEKAWNESAFTGNDTVVIPCPSEHKDLIDELVDDGYLRFSAPMICGKAPDGTVRARLVKGREVPNCKGFILERTHTEWESSGKSSSSYSVTRTMWVLDNKYIYLERGFDTANLREWFVSWIADGKPETEWERKQENKEMINRWKQQGLCTHCGGERSFWNGKCKQCGR